MEFRQLSYFIAISDAKSFTRAAEKLFVSQPALTSQINALEAELGMRLFERTNKSVKLTSAGEIFYLHAMQVLSEVNEALYHVKSMRDAWQKTVSFAIHPILAAAYLSEIYEMLRKRFDDHAVLYAAVSNQLAELSFPEKRLSFSLAFGSREERWTKSTLLAVAPMFLAALSEESFQLDNPIYTIPTDAGRLTEEIKDFLPQNARCSLFLAFDNAQSYLLSQNHIAVLPAPLIPKSLCVRPLDQALQAGIWLLEGDEEHQRQVKPALSTFFHNKGWEEYL